MDHRHKYKTIELVENNGKNLYDFEFGNDSLDTITKTLSMTEKKFDKLNFINIKNVCSAKDTVERVKKNGHTGRKYF